MQTTNKPSRWGTPEERFAENTEMRGGCLEWTGKRNQAGYGQMSVNGIKVTVHRYAYERAVGPIPDGMKVDHVCHNKSCVEPRHLRLATNKQNAENLQGARASSLTGVRGVYVDSRRRKFTAAVVHNYQRIHVGNFETLAEAEAAVVAKRNELFTHNDVDRR